MAHELIMSNKQLSEYLRDEDRDWYFDAARERAGRENALLSDISLRLPFGWAVSTLSIDDAANGLRIEVTNERGQKIFNMSMVARQSKQAHLQEVAKVAATLEPDKRANYLSRWEREEREAIEAIIAAK